MVNVVNVVKSMAEKPGFLKISSTSGQVYWFGHVREIHGEIHRVMLCHGVQMPEKSDPRFYDEIREMRKNNRSKLVFRQREGEWFNFGVIVDSFFLKTQDYAINGFYVVEGDGHRFFRVMETSEHRFRVETWGKLSSEIPCYAGTGISQIGGEHITLYNEAEADRIFGPFFQSTFFNHAGSLELTLGRQTTLSEALCKT